MMGPEGAVSSKQSGAFRGYPTASPGVAFTPTAVFGNKLKRLLLFSWDLKYLVTFLMNVV